MNEPTSKFLRTVAICLTIGGISYGAYRLGNQLLDYLKANPIKIQIQQPNPLEVKLDEPLEVNTDTAGSSPANPAYIIQENERDRQRALEAEQQSQTSE